MTRSSASERKGRSHDPRVFDGCGSPLATNEAFTPAGTPPKILTEKVFGELVALWATIADKQGSKKLNDAIERVGKSLNPELWIDPSHLDPKKGEKVFDGQKEAVKKLLELIKQGQEEHLTPTRRSRPSSIASWLPPASGRPYTDGVPDDSCENRLLFVVAPQLFQQRLVARLLKVGVACEGFIESMVLHDHKREAIDERPFLVAAAAVQSQSALEHVGRGRDNAHARVAVEQRDKFRRALAVGWSALRISQFDQYPFGGEEVGSMGLRKLNAALMGCVGSVEQPEEIERVGEDEDHRFGAPCA